MVNSIAELIAQLRKIYPNVGAKLWLHLCDKYKMYISRLVSIIDNFFCTNSEDNACRNVIGQYLKLASGEPNLVAGQIANWIICHTFYVAGVNHFWVMDQHNKWKRFGLFLHGCLDGFTGKILWLVIWWNNSSPRLVCAQYLKAVRHVGGMFSVFLSFVADLSNVEWGAPCVTQSDRGLENYNVVYAHTHIWHALNPTLSRSIQHLWKPGYSSIKPEQMWWQFCWKWTLGYEKLLEEGVKQQWFNFTNVMVLCLWTASHAYEGLITILAVYKNGPGLSRDNPSCLLFILPCSSVRFSEVLDSCTVQRHQVVDGSASEALQACEQYMEMFTLLCTVQETFTLLCTVHGAPHRS